jgi:hypothetical protein
MTYTLLSLAQKTADRPIATHRGMSDWWLWIVIGFIILLAIISFTGPGRKRSRRTGF